MFVLERDRIYMEEWKAFIVAIAAIAFGFEGFRILYVASRPLSYTGGVLAGAIVGFLAHELAHSWAGRREGCIAHFILSKIGLSLTLFFGLLRTFHIPFVILTPGYVQLYCMRSFAREDYIAAAGPLSNIIIALIGKLALRTPMPASIYMTVWGLADINAWLALFNLLPFAPLDGWKILRRNVVEWLTLFLLAIVAAYLL
jgi:Zn-dependent protease